MSSTKNSLLTHTSLSHDMINTINKYLDYSFENMTKIFNQNKQENKDFKLKDMTVEDILILCVQNGFGGFYIHKEIYNDIIVEIRNKIIKEKIICYEKEIRGNIVFYINSLMIPLTRISECWVLKQN